MAKLPQPAAMLLPLLLALLLLCGAGAAGTFEPLRLTSCPRGTLNLTLPEDLPVGSVLFSWDPVQLSVKSSLEEYQRKMNRALSVGRRVSPGARAFLSGGIVEDAVSVVPAATKAALVRALPAGGSDVLHGRFPIVCDSSAAAGAGSQFLLNLRLVRLPLRLLVESPTRRLAVSSWSPAGTVLANVSVWAGGRRVAPVACAVSGAPSGAALTVDGHFRLALLAPLKSRAASLDEWSATLACEWRGLRARQRVTVAPYRLWGRRVSRLDVGVSGYASALTGARIGVDLSAFLLRQGLRVRLVGSSGRDRVRLVPGTHRLLLDLPRAGDHMTVTLEAVDAEGRAETTVLQVVTGDGSPTAAPPCREPWPWWPVSLVVGAVALGLACAWVALHHRRLRARGRVGGLGAGDPLVSSSVSSATAKPQFV